MSNSPRVEARAQQISSYQPVQKQILGYSTFVAIFTATIEPDFGALSQHLVFSEQKVGSVSIKLTKALPTKKSNKLKNDLYELMLFQFQPKATMPGRLISDPVGTSKISTNSSKNSDFFSFFW